MQTVKQRLYIVIVFVDVKYNKDLKLQTDSSS